MYGSRGDSTEDMRDVIWFIVHVLQLIPIRFTQQISCCISKSIMKRLLKSTFHDLVMVIGSACLLIS